jgi:peptidyl-prolyl cis-trans isomerase C
LYSEQSELSEPGLEIRARHILVDTKEQAEQVKQALDDGKEFAALAFEKSKDSASRLEGGDLGFFSRDSLVKPFADIAFAMKDGETSDPVETRYGWHIIKVEGRRTAQAPDLEELRPSIVRFMTFDEIQRLVTDLREKASIEKVSPMVPSVSAEVQTATPESEQ